MKKKCLTMLTPILVLLFVAACKEATNEPTSLPQEVTSVAVSTTGVPPTLTETPPSPTQKPEAPTPTPVPIVLTSTPTRPQSSLGWPMFRFSLDRAGYNPNETSLKPPLALKWEYKTGSKI